MSGIHARLREQLGKGPQLGACLVCLKTGSKNKSEVAAGGHQVQGRGLTRGLAGHRTGPSFYSESSGQAWEALSS